MQQIKSTMSTIQSKIPDTQAGKFEPQTRRKSD